MRDIKKMTRPTTTTTINTPAQTPALKMSPIIWQPEKLTVSANKSAAIGKNWIFYMFYCLRY
jgi:hypothetical protein